MIARRGVLGLLAGGAVTLLGGCGPQRGGHYRFRLMVEVETPDGLCRGSSIFEVGYLPDSLPDRARHWSAMGEAVAVDLPGGRTLFALLQTINPMRADLAQMSMAALDPEFEGDVPESAMRIADGSRIRSPAEVPPEDYPLLVTFGAIDDPRTVERVDALNLPATFGRGVSLKRISVQITDDEPTSAIDSRLPWLTKYSDKMLDGSRTENSRHLAGSLSIYAFTNGPYYDE